MRKLEYLFGLALIVTVVAGTIALALGGLFVAVSAILVL